MCVRDPWLLVFDLDGTLIDSSLDLCLAVNAALLHVDRAPLPHHEITSFIGDGAAMLMQRALTRSVAVPYASPDAHGAEHNDFANALTFFLDFYREHKLDNTRLYDGVLAALTAIRDRRPDLPMAVLTNKPVRPSQEICEELGIAGFFFANYGGNTFATKKPDPTGLLTLMAEARSLRQKHASATLEPGSVVLVGDSEIDVLTAKRAGARSLGCRYGLAPHALNLARPDDLCDSPAEWPDLLTP